MRAAYEEEWSSKKYDLLVRISTSSTSSIRCSRILLYAAASAKSKTFATHCKLFYVWHAVHHASHMSV